MKNNYELLIKKTVTKILMAFSKIINDTFLIFQKIRACLPGEFLRESRNDSVRNSVHN